MCEWQDIYIYVLGMMMLGPKAAAPFVLMCHFKARNVYQVVGVTCPERVGEVHIKYDDHDKEEEISINLSIYLCISLSQYI